MRRAGSKVRIRRLIGEAVLIAVLTVSIMSGGTVQAADDTLATCPETSAAGFSDLSGLSDEAIHAIDCLAHHAVSRGTSTTTFSPLDPVPRWQMALFLQRTAEAIRVGLPLVTASPFQDTDGLSPETRLAIDRLAAAGIVSGTEQTLFEPLSHVPRWQMALFLDRLVDRAAIPSPPDANRFADLDGVPSEAVEAIAGLDAIGIVRGTGDDRYEPWRLVSRWEMAVFLSRLLEAGNADPVRLEIDLSRDSAEFVGAVIATIGVSKPNGDPFPGVLVDVFVADTIASDGSCRLDLDASVNGGDAGSSQDCTIDIGDPRSNSKGEVTVGLAHAHIAETDSIYVWAGDIGETFDGDTVTMWASTTLRWLAAPSELTLTFPDSASFGESVAVTARLVGAGSGELLYVDVERNGITVVSRTATTGSDGTASWAHVGPTDPSEGDDPPVVDTMTVFWDRNRNGIYDGPAEFTAVRAITWDDAP